MKLLELMLEEQKRLKLMGFKPKFKGDTGINVAKIMIDNKVELRNEWDRSFVDGFKQLNNK